MRAGALTIAILLAAPACNSDAPPAPPPQPPPTLVAPLDAAGPYDGGITVITAYDPATGMHLDEADLSGLPSEGNIRPRNRRRLEILLRSTPPGALVIVAGQRIGETPTYWEGEFDGKEREFAFVLRGYALARYRFIPTSSGIVHARLTPVTYDQLGDAAMPYVPTPPRGPIGPQPQPQPQPPPPQPQPRSTTDARPRVDAATAVDATTAPEPGSGGPVGPPP